MAVTTQELKNLAVTLVKNKMNRIDNVDTINELGLEALSKLLVNNTPAKMILNGIKATNMANQEELLLKLKIFILYNLFHDTKEKVYYKKIHTLINELLKSQLSKKEATMFKKLLQDAQIIISGGNSAKPIDAEFTQTPELQNQRRTPQKEQQQNQPKLIEPKQQPKFDSLEQINAKIQQLQKEQDLEKQILQQKYNRLRLMLPGSPQYPIYNQLLLASYNKEVAEYENLRKKYQERNQLIAYYKKKSLIEASLLGIQHTQLVMPAKKQIAAQQALENARIAGIEAEQAKQALENARIAQMKIAEQANQARVQQIAAQQRQALENARIAQIRQAEQDKKAREQQIRITADPKKEISFTKPTNVPNINPSYKYFTPEQEKAIREYFSKNPNARKIKRSLDRKGQLRTNTSVGIKEYPIANLPYSVIKTEQGQLFVITGNILGKGGMSVVKVAESLDHPGNIVAAKIQGSTKHNQAYRDRKAGGYNLVPEIQGTKDEESILAILEEFLGHASNSFLCKLGFAKNKYDKQYTFLKLKKGQTVFKCFEINKNNLKTNQIGQLKIFLAILQATKKLHDHKIIHGDLNFNNFMINDEGQVDVIDYGMAGKANERGLIKNNNGSQWVAPEARPQGIHNFKSDIYTLGWWMQAMLKHFATSSSLKTNKEFTQLLDDMTCYNRTNPNSYQSRPTIDQCINRISSILEKEEKLQRNKRSMQ